MTTTQPLLNPGDIFSIDSYDYRGNKKRVYWKVTDIRQYKETSSYQVVKCSKTGKEYKDRNGFSTTIDKILLNEPIAISRDNRVDFNIVKRNTVVGVKANLEPGLATGKIKRRRDYLVARIETDKRELQKLPQELAALETN